jgi:type I restriction enzyme S subunit
MTDASWVETQLGKVCTLEKRAVHPSRLGPTLVNHFSLPAFDLGKNPERVSAVEIKSNKLEVPPRSVLVSKLNPQTPRIWEPKVSNEEINVCSTEFAVLLPNESLYPGFLRYWIESEPVYSKIEELANGTSSSHQRVNLDDMMKISALLPPREIQEKITKLLSLFDQKIESRLRSESNILEIGDLMLSQLKQDGETRNVTVNELAEFHNKKRQPLSRLERDKRPGIYRYFGATSIFGYVDDYR